MFAFTKSYWFFIWLACLTLANPGCRSVSSGSSRDKIVGGEPTATSRDQRAFAATVELEFVGSSPNSPGGSCTGTIIGPQQIVTAAHCIKQNENAPLNIYSMVDHHNFDVIRVTAHPRWWGNESKLAYDIGVISFKIADTPSPNLVNSRDFTPVTVAPAGRLQVGDEVLLAGYGDREGGKSTLHQLYQVKTTVASLRNDTREFSITSNTGKGPCNGDSGGPAYLDENGTLKLVGATSRNTDGKCDIGQGIYTDVTRFQGWMKCVFAQHGTPLSSLADDDSAVDCSGI